ncbi:MAG: hypothetical protein J7K53_02845 [Bacteroidales bacterium]|nr:hypothetical protein [Bacteroidales bacterium]
MKRIIQIFYLFSTLFMVVVTGCQKEPLKAEYKGISVEQNGIAIEFCLLNEKGEPDTVLKEGENFKFFLAITNNVEPDTSMYIVSEFLRNPDLFMVFSSADDTIGKPVGWNGMYKISDCINQIYQGEKWSFEIPWHETRGTEEPFDGNNLIRVLQHFFFGT